MKMPTNEHRVLFYVSDDAKECYVITQVQNTDKYILYTADAKGTLIEKLKTANTPVAFSECY